MGYKLIMINNSHDARSAAIVAQIQQAKVEGLLPEETHIVDFDQIQGISIQAAPAMFILGTDDLLADFTGDQVLNILDFLKRKRETEQALDDMAALLKEAEII